MHPDEGDRSPCSPMDDANFNQGDEIHSRTGPAPQGIFVVIGGHKPAYAPNQSLEYSDPDGWDEEADPDDDEIEDIMDTHAKREDYMDTSDASSISTKHTTNSPESRSETSIKSIEALFPESSSPISFRHEDEDDSDLDISGPEGNEVPLQPDSHSTQQGTDTDPPTARHLGSTPTHTGLHRTASPSSSTRSKGRPEKAAPPKAKKAPPVMVKHTVRTNPEKGTHKPKPDTPPPASHNQAHTAPDGVSVMSNDE